MKDLVFLVLVNLFVVLAWLNFDISKTLRIVLIILQSLFFLFWGLEIHAKENKLNKNNLLEYGLLGLLAIALVIILIYYD